MQLHYYHDFITRQPVTQVADFATCEGCAPRVRPVVLICHDGALWVATGAHDAKVAQINANPLFECLIHTSDERGRGYYRLRGRVVQVQDTSQKEELMRIAPFIRQYFSGADDPEFTLLKLNTTEGEYMPPTQDFTLPLDMLG